MKFSISKDKTKKEAKLLRLNCRKVLRFTQWKPAYNFSKTVKDTVEWYKHYYLKSSNIIDFSNKQIENYVNFRNKK